MKKAANYKITTDPWEILTQFICHNGPYTSQDLLCFEEWMKGPKMYKEYIIDEVKTKLSETYGQGTGTSFSKDFPDLCQEPHCWPGKRDLKYSDWIGFKTLHLKNLSLFVQRQEQYDIQVYSWKGLLGRDGPYKSEDLKQFEKWMKETKVYHNYNRLGNQE
jgi:hypothetical protein